MCLNILLPAHLLGVENNLLELSGLGKALDDLVGDVGTQVDGESQRRVRRLDQVTKLLTTLKLQWGRNTAWNYGLDTAWYKVENAEMQKNRKSPFREDTNVNSLQT